MAYDKAVDSAQLNADLTSVANAIRAKSGGNSPLAFPSGFVSEVGSIQTGGVVTPLNVTQNGTYTAPAGEGYSPVTVNVSGGGGGGADPSKPVKFIDYDGTLLYSYTVAELQELTELPENPTHAGLTSQGWNWTLAQAKAQLTAMPDAGLTIGQMYITDDGKTRIYCHFETGRLAPYLGLGVNGTVEVDWGDGSGTDTLTGTSLRIAQTVQHTYSAAGDYTITLTVESGEFSFFGNGNAAHILKKSTATSAYINCVYSNTVQRVEMGTSAIISDHAFLFCTSLASITIPSGVTDISSDAFSSCYSLASITIPSSVTNIGNSAFGACYSLASITMPSGVMNIGSSAFSSCCSLTSITIPSGVINYIGGYAFQNCGSLASVTIPSGVTRIGGNVFQTCYSLASVTIPSSVTNIGSNVFQKCYGLAELHFLPSTPPTVSNANAFTNLQTDCIIYVPTGSLEAYTSATNYPSSSKYTYLEE